MMDDVDRLPDSRLAPTNNKVGVRVFRESEKDEAVFRCLCRQY